MGEKISIVDSHVHLWTPARFRYAWLDNLPTLNRPFLPKDFSVASSAANMGKMIFVECGCRSEDSLAEVAWVMELARNEPRLKAIVAAVQLEKGRAIEAELETLAACTLVKGVRRNLQGESDMEFCQRAGFVEGVRLLARHHLTFDICIRADQLQSATALVRAVPEVNFILDHCGKPPIHAGRKEPWAADLKKLAALPNVACKLSGLTTEADWQNWQPADLEFYVTHALECFGPDRILFGGDWPVATLATDYHHWIDTLLGLLTSSGVANTDEFFKTNAERIYRV